MTNPTFLDVRVTLTNIQGNLVASGLMHARPQDIELNARFGKSIEETAERLISIVRETMERSDNMNGTIVLHDRPAGKPDYISTKRIVVHATLLRECAVHFDVVLT